MKKGIFPKYSGYVNTGKHDYDCGLDVGRRQCHKKAQKIVKTYCRRKGEKEIQDQLTDIEEERIEREKEMRELEKEFMLDFEFLYNTPLSENDRKYMEYDLGVSFDFAPDEENDYELRESLIR